MFSGPMWTGGCSEGQSLAAGAIYGLIGAEAVWLLRHRSLIGREKADKALWDVGSIVALNFLIGRGLFVDHWGHLGGALGGAVAAYLLGPAWRRVKTNLVDFPPIPVLVN